MSLETVEYQPSQDPDDDGMDSLERMEHMESAAPKPAEKPVVVERPAVVQVDSDIIPFTHFAAIDLRVAKILEVEEVPGARKPLYKLRIDVGELGERQLVAGIKAFYSRDELIGKKIVIVANLAPRSIAGIPSQGMLLAAEDGTEVSLLQPDRDMKEGCRIG